ncbi:crossover junction endonuclease EME1 [Denticeps clupeoides]|uniref:crossover junction endonuclease EME1 n=1 Tax=Denticeps clupeoides TaxID=299321 RepID=UPI0010A4D97E|nr:crossover junction endonuclease EME1 [Denticeps clupeoides]
MATNSSDSEDFPVFDFLQPRSGLPTKPDLLVVNGSDSEMPPTRLAVAEKPAVLLISSESEEEDFIPLAERLRQRQESLTEGHPCTTNGGSATALSSQHKTASAPSEGYAHISTHNPVRAPKETSAPCPENIAQPAKRKRTTAETEAARLEAVRRRAERERQQEEKERQKMEKRTQAETLKAMKPEECLKYMVVSVDPALLQLEGGGALLTSLQELGCCCAIEKQPLPRSITWARRSPNTQMAEPACVAEPHTVIHVPMEDFIIMVHRSSQDQRNALREAGLSLTSWVTQMLDGNSSQTPSLVVMDIEKYFKSQKSKSQKKLREAVLGDSQRSEVGAGRGRKRKDWGGSLPEVSRVDVEESLVHLQLHTGVQARFVSNWKEFCDYVAMSTKAVAEAPFKREREQTAFGFFVENEWAGGHRVDREGNGLLQVWKRQIQQLNRVSPDMASAILSTYPSPQLLLRAYKQCASERERVALLSDMLIRRGEGVTSTTRRVGPELSKRLFLMMTSADPHQALDSTA